MDREAEGFIPQEEWNEVQRRFALPYIELGIVRRAAGGGVEILLAHRTDEHWTGWHLPGGLWRTPHTLEQGVDALARQELGEGARVELLEKGMWEKWDDHPYGHPISHVVICSATGITETAELRWFTEAPEDMIADNGHHARFAANVLEQAEQILR